MIYCPLDEDGEAMQLLKTFDIVVEREKDTTFGVTLFEGAFRGGHPTHVARHAADLNRALVEVVAKMQARRIQSPQRRVSDG